ncbi:MAG: sterol desaturase family protein [Deltaproteobacteria bacterium]|jgi:hypothetical protein|nr:sterol desaturase family protein [Deltaproteobacteria bacterium]MBW2536876.1 sterol desaturase family protein [Deltaproteobacteria bacterium]
MKSLLSALAGAATWTLAEYGIHRHLGHDPELHPNPFSREHRRHHATTSYFAPSYLKVLAAAGALAAVAPAASALLGLRAGTSFAAGFASAYLGYEVVHRLAHVAAPRTSYGRWLRRHHFHHHFHNPKRNHGVTSPLWDHLFGTFEEPSVVRVPAKHVMPWLLDPMTRQLRPEHVGDYEVRSTKPKQHADAAAPPIHRGPKGAPEPSGRPAYSG